MPEVISEHEAIKRGVTKFFTGKPCWRGHMSERQVGAGCLVCMRKTQRLRMRKKRKDNPEKERNALRERMRKLRASPGYVRPDRVRVRF